jgi:hypothetical protein
MCIEQLNSKRTVLQHICCQSCDRKCTRDVGPFSPELLLSFHLQSLALAGRSSTAYHAVEPSLGSYQLSHTCLCIQRHNNQRDILAGQLLNSKIRPAPHQLRILIDPPHHFFLQTNKRMKRSVTTDDIDMPCAPVMTDRKRSSKKRVVKNTPINKAHVTRQPFYPRGEPHPAVRAKVLQMKTSRRMDITPLPRSRLAQKPLGLRFTKHKSSWKTLLHAYMLEMSYLRDVGMWSSFNSMPCAQYDEMDCEYDTMDSRFAYYMSYGVFGSPSPAFDVLTASTNSFGSSTGSGGAVSTFSAATRSCPVSG